MQSVRAHGYDTTPKWPGILSYSYDGVKNLPEFFVINITRIPYLSDGNSQQ